MSPFGVEHTPLIKGWAGSARTSKEAMGLLRNGRLVARQNDKVQPKSRHFRTNAVDAVTTHRVSSKSRVISTDNEPDAIAGVMRAGAPSYKKRTGKKRPWNQDVNGFDPRVETPGKRWVSDDPEYRQYRGDQR